MEVKRLKMLIYLIYSVIAICVFILEVNSKKKSNMVKGIYISIGIGIFWPIALLYHWFNAIIDLVSFYK